MKTRCTAESQLTPPPPDIQYRAEIKNGGGGVSKRPKIEKNPTKIVRTGSIKLPRLLCCKPGLFYKIDPPKSQNGACYRFQNGSLQKISPFRGALDFLGPKMALGWRLVPFNGPKKSWAPRKGSIFCRTHLETYNRPHLVILGGRFYKTPHGLQHRSLNSYKCQ